MTMFPSACIWAYRLPITQVLREIKETAYHFVDVETDVLDNQEAIDSIKALGLKISCVALDRKLPAGSCLDGKDAGATRNAAAFVKKAIEKCQPLAVQAAFVSPCSDRKNLKTYSCLMAELAEDAAGKGIRFCIEHAPGSALPSAREALAFVEAVSNPNMHLLLNVGHTLLSKEKPWEIVAAAGKRIGYVHFSDNDGKSDRQWPLLDGRLTLDDLTKTIEALKVAGYGGTLGMELIHDRASLVSVFSRNRNLILRLQATSEVKSLKEPEARRKQ
jgi:sugar phosphate isomerase/epimerase